MTPFERWQENKCRRYYENVDDARLAYRMARRYGEPEEELKIYFEEMQAAERELDKALRHYNEAYYDALFD